MKTLNTLLTVMAVSITLSVTADPNLAGGPQLGKRTPDRSVAVASACCRVKDANLAVGPQLGKRTPDRNPALAAGGQDPDLLAGVTKCAMAPKAKGTPACAKHCELAEVR